MAVRFMTAGIADRSVRFRFYENSGDDRYTPIKAVMCTEFFAAEIAAE